jgi:hypothetical protein
MLSMVALLALVLVAIERASQPSSWYWLTGPPRPTAGSTTQPGPDHDPARPPTPTPEIRAAVAIPAEDLAAITDDSVGLRSEEIGPYHRILARARDLPNRYLESVASDTAFPVLLRQPEQFRGSVISVAGDLRRLMRFPIRENDEGISELYEALVFTADSGTTPYRIRLTQPPLGLPTGRMITPPVPVRVVGYFFKRDQYIVEEDLRIHSAPMLLAQRIDRRIDRLTTSTRLSTSDAQRMRWAVTLLGVVVGGLALTLAWSWRMRSGDRRFAREGLKRATAAPEGAIEALAGIKTVDPEEFFREMSEQEAVGDDSPATDSPPADSPPAD